MRAAPAAATSRRTGWIAALLRLVIGGLARTCRVQIVAGAQHLDALAAQPMVLAGWHQRIVPTAIFVRRRLRRQPLATLISQSRDGELGARVAAAWGVTTVRGSSSRGGRDALRALYRVVRGGTPAVFFVDGPRGPARVCKPGATTVAQLARAPVLPLGVAASRVKTLRSWDRMHVPLPFSRIAVVVGPPLDVPRASDPAALDDPPAALADALAAAEAQAEAFLDPSSAVAEAAAIHLDSTGGR